MQLAGGNSALALAMTVLSSLFGILIVSLKAITFPLLESRKEWNDSFHSIKTKHSSDLLWFVGSFFYIKTYSWWSRCISSCWSVIQKPYSHTFNTFNFRKGKISQLSYSKEKTLWNKSTNITVQNFLFFFFIFFHITGSSGIL